MLRIWRTTATNVIIVYGVVFIENKLCLRRLTWKLHDDSGAPENEDDIDAVSLTLSEVLFAGFLVELRNIRFPAFASLPIGLDGETHGIELEDFPTNLSLRWWCSAPSSWKELEQWFRKIEGSFDKLLPAIPSHFPIGYRSR